MFKRISKKNESKSTLLKSMFVDEASNFKSGAIEISSKEKKLIVLDKLNELLGVPKKNQQFRIITKKNINSFDFILAVLGNNEIIEEMIIAFYRIGKKVIIELNELQKLNEIRNIAFLINDGFPKLVPDAYKIGRAHV